MMHPQADDFPAQIENVVQAFLGNGRDAGARALGPIAYPPREIDKRPQLGVALRCQIFQRDHFHCRYCGGRTILAGVMELLAGVFPDEFPFHRNWKGGQTHPAFIARGAMVDHVEPVALGGVALDPMNLVTACNPCNSNKADLTLEQIGWKVQEIVDDGWDGLTGYYEKLWQEVGRPNPNHHRSFMRHLGLITS